MLESDEDDDEIIACSESDGGVEFIGQTESFSIQKLYNGEKRRLVEVSATASVVNEEDIEIMEECKEPVSIMEEPLMLIVTVEVEEIPQKTALELVDSWIQERNLKVLFTKYQVSKRNQKRLAEFLTELTSPQDYNDIVLYPKNESSITVPIYSEEHLIFEVVLDCAKKSFTVREAQAQTAPEVQIKPSLL